MRRARTGLVWAGCWAVLAATVGVGGLTTRAAIAATPFRMGPALNLPASNGGTEPRVAVGPGNHSWLITNDGNGAVVYGSTDGVLWTKTAGRPVQTAATIDVDIVTTRTGRIVANELDASGPSIITSYSDDGGVTWKPSGSTALSAVNGTQIADQDRNWLAVGPDDPTTHQPRVYNFFHNLVSGTVTHNMYVQTSSDGGATFGTPTPTTLPGDQAWLDLQCADSGGPSNITVNQQTGQVYAIFGTRSSTAGGCGASITGNFEVNVVAATRVWVATAMPADTATAGAWKQSLAVDANAAGHIVGMQLAPGAVDNAGNVYIFYPESIHGYPDYEGSALKYTHAPSDLSTWSAPVTVAPPGGAGHLLPHVVVGDPGKIDFAYFEGVLQPPPAKPLWYAWAAQTLNGLDQPTAVQFTRVRLSGIPTYQWTASEMMGACAPNGPTAGVQNGFLCSRSTDVWGVALDNNCQLEVTWPAVGGTGGPPDPPNSTANMGTYEATQSGGPTVCTKDTFPPNTAPATAVTSPPTPLPNTAGARSGSALPTAWPLVLGIAATALLTARSVGRRRRAG
ncbi:MAG: glycoside hydrolase [Candidatus Dormibacteraeota bacterium]|nr:glycoside hydrolase [Candidatus Dormibacteraeota bacterium]